MTKVNIPFDLSKTVWSSFAEWCLINGLTEHIHENQEKFKHLNQAETIAQWIQDLKDDLKRHKQVITDTLSFLDKKLQAGNEHSN